MNLSRTRIPVAIAIATLLMASGARDGAAQSPPAAPGGASPVANWLPAGTLIHGEFTLAPFLRHGAELSLVKLFRDPEVRRVLSGTTNLLGRLRENVSALLDRVVGLPLDDLRPLLLAPTTISLQGYRELAPPGLPSMQVPLLLVTWKVGASSDAGHTLVGSVEKALGERFQHEFAEIEIEGIKGRRFISAEPGRPALFWIVHEQHLLLATERSVLESAVRRSKLPPDDESLSLRPEFQRARARVQTDRTWGFVYAEMSRLIREPKLNQALEPLGIARLPEAWLPSSIGIGLGLDGEALVNHILVQWPADSEANAALEAFASGILTAPDFLPAETMFEVNFPCGSPSDPVVRQFVEMLPAPEFHQLFVEAWQQGNPAAEGAAASGRAGSEAGAFVLPAASGPLPDWGVWGGLRNPAAVEAFLRAAPPPGFAQRTMREIKFQGQSIFVAETEHEVFGIFSTRNMKQRSSLAVVDGRLVATMWPQAIKNFIQSRKEGRPRLAASPRWQAAFLASPGVPAPVALGSAWIDTQAVMAAGLGVGVPLIQNGILGIDSHWLSIDWVDFPPIENVTRHLTPTSAALVREPNGLLFTLRGPLDAGVALGLLASRFLPDAGPR